MKILVGDETGLCKVIHFDKKQVAHKFGVQARGRAVHAIHWSGREDVESEVTVVYKNGLVEVYEAQTYTKLENRGCEAFAEANGRVIFSEVRGERLLLVSSSGCGRLFPKWTDQASSSSSFQLPPPVSAVSVHPTNASILAFGGEENDLKCFDVSKDKIVWKAKNLPNDHLDLRIPVRISIVQFVRIEERLLLFVGTKDGKIRVYDTAVQRRPLLSIPVCYRVTRSCAYTASSDKNTQALLCSFVKGDSIFLGDNVGNVCTYSLAKLKDLKASGLKAGRKAQLDHAREQLPYVAGFKGIMGSVRDIACHATENVVAVAGLGRFAYLYNAVNRKMLAKVYLKQKLNCVLFSAQGWDSKDSKDSKKRRRDELESESEECRSEHEEDCISEPEEKNCAESENDETTHEGEDDDSDEEDEDDVDAALDDLLETAGEEVSKPKRRRK